MSRLPTLTLALLVSTSLPLRAQIPQKLVAAKDLSALQAALRAYDQGNLPRAEPTLRSLALRYPDNYQVNEALGSIYAETNQLERALSYLQRASKMAPREPLAHANLGAVYLKLFRPQDAVPELQRAVTLDPHNPQTQDNLGQALMLQKQPAAAAKAFSIAAQATPTDYDLKYNLALALFNSGANKEAAATLEAIPAPSQTPEMHSLSGDAEERAGEFVKALAHYEAAARLDPTDANLYALTLELLRHWNWEEAIKVADFATTRYPASRHFKFASGLAYYGKSDYPPAVKIFSSLLQQDPSDATAADLLGRSCMDLADGPENDCGGVFDYVQAHPGNAIMMTYGAVALLHAAQGEQNLDRAAAMLQAAIEADPRYAEAYLRMGVVEQMRSHWSQSATLLEHYLALNPGSAEAHYRLSRAYFRLGRKEEGQQQLALRESSAKAAKEALDGKTQELMRFVLTAK